MNKLTQTDFEKAAAELKIPVKVIHALAVVESSGAGYMKDGRVKIRFEPHVFRKYTQGKFDKKYPHLSAPYRRGYQTDPVKSWSNFLEACKLNAKAAVFACSWGMFQIMGYNFALAGFTTATKFVEAMERGGESAHLAAFVDYIISRGLADEIQRGEMDEFFYRYNGEDYEANGYPQMYAKALKSLK